MDFDIKELAAIEPGTPIMAGVFTLYANGKRGVHAIADINGQRVEHDIPLAMIKLLGGRLGKMMGGGAVAPEIEELPA
jgi:hypothetical protein